MDASQIFDPVKYAVAMTVKSTLKKSFSVDLSVSDLVAVIEKPPEPTLGDYAFPCFRIAKQLKLNPAALAQDLATALTKQAPIVTASAAAAFLNLKIDESLHAVSLFTSIADQSFFRRLATSRQDAKQRVMIEFSQPNTHKDFHIGHVRNVSIGDSMVRLYRYWGDEVTAANYPGDEGTHIAKCLWYLRKQNLKAPRSGQGEWLGSVYADAVRALADAPKDSGWDKEVGTVLRAIESKQGEIYELWKQTREWSLALFHEIYQFLDVGFDVYFFESELSEDSQKIVDEFLKKGVFVVSEGAVGADLSDAKLGFMMVRKSDGNTLYATKDLVLARRKFADFNIQRSIYVVAAEQNLHFRQVFKTLALMGFPQAKDCFHLSYGHVRLPEGKMSSRDGTAVSFATMRVGIEAELDKALAETGVEWDEDERLETRRRLCIAAIKYGMLSTDPVKDVVYRAEDWVSFEGDSGPYLLYSYARTRSILRKALTQGLVAEASLDCAALLVHPSERELLRLLYDFNDAVFRACTQCKPSIMTHHLYDCCKAFNRMYTQVSVLRAESQDIARARLRLLEAHVAILAKGLELLGMTPVEKM